MMSVTIPGPRDCARCEYFDGGGEAIVQQALDGLKIVNGDCLNSQSPRFQTTSHDTCASFVEASDETFPWECLG